MHTSIHSEVAKIIRHPHAMVYGLYVVSPAIGLSCHRRLRKLPLRKLDAGVEASGPHDFTVRFSIVRYRYIDVHRIPPRVRDDREPPLKWDETARNTPVIWVGCEEEIFLQMGLDTPMTDLPAGQLALQSGRLFTDLKLVYTFEAFVPISTTILPAALRLRIAS
jgi:hypothetical protein